MQQPEGKRINAFEQHQIHLINCFRFQVTVIEIDEVTAHAMVSTSTCKEQPVHEHPEGRHHHECSRHCKLHWMLLVIHSVHVSIFQVVSLFTIVTGIFDLYCYSMAAPGSTHYGYYIISYEFVYVGNMHVRNVLVIFALFSVLAAFVTFITSILLVAALRKVS